MIIHAIEVSDGKKIDVIYGNYPDEHINDLEIGMKVPVELNHIKIGEYEIKGIKTKKSDDIPYVELTVEKVF